MRQVEQRVTERAKQEIEAERRSLREMMKDEMLQLQSHLSMFEKVTVVQCYDQCYLTR